MGDGAKNSKPPQHNGAAEGGPRKPNTNRRCAKIHKIETAVAQRIGVDHQRRYNAPPPTQGGQADTIHLGAGT